MDKNILVLGNGFLGSAFEHHGYTVLGRDMFEWDIENKRPVQTDHAIMGTFKKYTAVVNCIGISTTQWCENPDNWKIVNSVNGLLPQYLSKLCSKCGVSFVHVSSGCLYDISEAPQNECDNVTSNCAYVHSKFIGEMGCDLTRDLILRPRLLYGDFEPIGRNNLLKKIREFKTCTRELNSLTSVHTIVNATQSLISANAVGVFNIADRGYMSMHHIANLFNIEHDIIDMHSLRKKLGIHLVNSTMDIDKLCQFHAPPRLEDELVRCWTSINNL